MVENDMRVMVLEKGMERLRGDESMDRSTPVSKENDRNTKILLYVFVLILAVA